MKYISSYITEKFKISKSTKGVAPKVEYITDNYSKGDICLKLVQAGIKSQTRIYLDLIRINLVLETSLILIKCIIIN